jgi:fatty acid desaturase
VDHRLHDGLHPLTLQLPNPIRSEADAFRMVVIVVCAAAAVIALTLLAGALWGALLGLLLIGVGVWLAVRTYLVWLGEGEATESEEPTERPGD